MLSVRLFSLLAAFLLFASSAHAVTALMETGVSSTGYLEAVSATGAWVATQTEAQTGTNDDQIMTPLKTKQAINTFGSGLPAGAVVAFGMSTPPTGWLEANGTAISRTTYSSLFAAIGTTYGAGDGSTTFNLPDLRGEFIRGWDNGRGVDTSRTIGSAQASQNLAHTHGITDPGHSHVEKGSTGTSSGATFLSVKGTSNDINSASNAATTGITINSSGGTEARPRNISMMYCVKF